MAASVEMWNILVMGFAFMFIFTAFQTTSMIEPTVLQSYKNSTNPDKRINGYTSLGIIYSVFTISNWLAPSFIGVFGPRVSMIVGGICYALFISSLIEPRTWSVYSGSVVIGYGASVIWTGQGNFLTINSTPETISRNSGIFWALLQSSLLFGNMYVYFKFKGQEETISNPTRRNVYTVFTTICGLGICLLFLLRKPRDMVIQLNEGEKELSQNIRPRRKSSEKRTALESLKIAVKMFFTKDMLLLSLCFAYTGIELTFFSGVYGTCVGNTSLFSDAKRQIGLVGMLIGCGEISGGLMFGIFGKRTNKFGREPIVFLGMICHWICFLLIFLNLPDMSPLQAVSRVKETYIIFHPPSLPVAVVCAFLLGFGDSSFNTQIYSILGSLYEEDSAPAFALFKFVQSLTAAIAFFYSLQLSLRWQLLILVISSLFGTLGFFLVEWKARRIVSEGYAPISS
ncbi:UNC93-like protein MFSD11 [Montipora capricornis]|uniref:UNC93-like protein MFSD11 n=1 Tax=Montipora capricornis TaxID=246305 RepID=UPI0035F10849